MAIAYDFVALLHDPAYVQQLNERDWSAIVSDPQWVHLTEEYADLTAQIIADYGHLMGTSYMQVAAPPDNLGARQTTFQYLGQRMPRTHGLGVVSNVGVYTQNLNHPNQVLHEDLAQPASARQDPQDRLERGGEVRRAWSRCCTASNLPREYQRIKLGGRPPDRLLFPEEVFEVGAPVALVLAESEDIADEAMRLIKVEYEILPAVMTISTAMKSSTPKQWDNKLDGTTDVSRHPFKRGDPDAPSPRPRSRSSTSPSSDRAAGRARADQQRHVVGKRPPEP